MCLAIPGRVQEIDRTGTPVMGDVDFGGITKRVCLEWLPDIAVGEYVIVHVGFAISKVDEKEALETLELFEKMGKISDELEGDDSGTPGPDDGEDKQ
jgi:hydrogenase expression/formation protein HypC